MKIIMRRNSGIFHSEKSEFTAPSGDVFSTKDNRLVEKQF